MEYFASEQPQGEIDETQARSLLATMLSQMGNLKRVLIIPPDYSRFDSWAGKISVLLYQLLIERGAEVHLLPALGTHFAMTPKELDVMFPGIPHDRFHVHNFREDVKYLGDVPAEFVRAQTNGLYDEPVPIGVNKMLLEPWDRIFSVGQLVPHEVIGIANYNKNIFIGVGGAKTIHRSHFISALIGLENLMGTPMNPVRAILNYGSEHFAKHLPITFLLTVRGFDAHNRLLTRAFYAGDDQATYLKGAELAVRLNINHLDRPRKKVVAFMNPQKYKSTWLANKAVYRSRMAIADAGELVVLAEGVKEFGEDKEIDLLIREHGYNGTRTILEKTKSDPALGNNLSAAAHLIHGSSEGRFTITYCPGALSPDEIKDVNYQFGDIKQMLARYNPDKLVDGDNIMPDGEEIYFIRNPGMGLWMAKQGARA